MRRRSLEDALALIVREHLTGAPPPETAKAMVDLWRSWIEERAGRTLSRLGKVADDQAQFGRALREMLKTFDLATADRREMLLDKDRLHALGLQHPPSWATGNRLRDMQAPPKAARAEGKGEAKAEAKEPAE